MIKVLFVTNLPSPYRVEFFNELGKHVELTVIYERHSASDRDSKWKGTKANWFNEIYLNSRCIGTDKTIGFQLIKEIKKHKFDFLVFCGYNSPSVMFAITYCRFHKIPFYIESDGGFNKKDKFPKNLLKKFLICKAQGHFVTCEEYKKYLLGLGVSEEIIYKYPFSSIRKADIIDKPVDMTTKIALRHKLGIKEEKVVISVGRFIPIKGFDILIKASAKFDRNVGVYIIGGVPTDEYIELVKSLSVSNIHFIDFLSKEELDEYYMASDLFVLPSRGDVWGLVTNEAMSKGLPIITTYSCVAGKELVKNGENGFLVSPNSPNELYDKMFSALSSGAEFMNKKSLEVIRSYTIENMVKLHLYFFKTIYR